MSRPASESVGAVKHTRTASLCTDSIDQNAACARSEPRGASFGAPSVQRPSAGLHSSAMDKPSASKPATSLAVPAPSMLNSTKLNPRKRARPVAASAADAHVQAMHAPPSLLEYAPYSARPPLESYHTRPLHVANGLQEVKNGNRIQHALACETVPKAPFLAPGSSTGVQRAAQALSGSGEMRGHCRMEAPEKRPRTGVGVEGGGGRMGLGRSVGAKVGGAYYTLPTEDDAEGHLIYTLGEGLHPSKDFPNGRYKILSDLGEGTFGKVVECWDRQKFHRVAVKVVRNVSKYREAARLEIDVLVHLNTHDPDCFYHCVKLCSWFDYRGHVCMVFEKLGPSLYEQLRRNRFQPFPLDQVREYAFQLLESVNFVHNLTLIHTDLKPENILLIDSKQSNAIKLIDFGSATFERQHHSAVISTRHYRAPEVILGLGWTYPCDLWSIGCILVELYTGQALFQTHENLEHLAMMSGVLGPIPDSMIRRADRSGQKYFSRLAGGRRSLNWPAGASSKASVHSVRRVRSLQDIIRCPNAHKNFFDLVRRLLTFEPDTRCTSAEALKHPFFREESHEADPPVTTPTISSGSSACGSHIGRGQRGKLKAALRRTPRSGNPVSSRASSRHAGQTRHVDDDREDLGADLKNGAEHSDHTTVVAPLSPRRPL